MRNTLRPGSREVPLSPLDGAPGTGLLRLALGGARDALLLAMAGEEPRPLWVAFHGAGADAMQMVDVLAPAAKRYRVHLLSLDARGRTWEHGSGVDLRFLETALERTCASVQIDSRRLCAVGYSDGGSYALGLGLRNAALFSRVLALSPGFAPTPQRGPWPTVYIAHGRADRVLPIDRCGRKVARQLSEAGVAVHYAKHDGGHELSANVIDEAARWLAGGHDG
jgi:phospholipase/carboxylesterase